MRHVLYFAFCVALKSLGTAALMSHAWDLSSSDPSVVGGSLHPCYRECVANDTRICYYEFSVLEWLSMSTQCSDCPYTENDCYNRGCITAGGNVRRVTVVNHMLPGPSIQVCKGDTIQVNVTNVHSSEGTTIHWHGIYQSGTPYMDGVPFLTQCPILPGNTFLYDFVADPAGTHIWHSHVGFQETDGLHGALVIREPTDVNADYYDYDLAEHVMVIWHFYNNPTATSYLESLYGGTTMVGYDYVVNGHSAKVEYTENSTVSYTPRASFNVTKGYTYRFRVIINTGIYCPVQVSIDNHTLEVIATDGAAVEPVQVDSFVGNAGERWDFILTADKEEDNYWIRYRGFGKCDTVSTVAILHYEGAGNDEPSGTTTYDDAIRSGVLVNPVGEADTDYSNNTLIRVSDLINAMESDVQNVSGTPDEIFYVEIGMNKYANYQVPGAYGQCNNISFSLPRIPPLTQYHQLTSDMYCTQTDNSSKVCHDEYCTCPYIYTVGTGKLVEIILVDTTAAGTDDHPMHMHGHFFRVVGAVVGTTANITLSEVKALNEAGSIEKNLDTAPLKDTIGVPARGFVVLRVVTDNPGFWLFHCHVATHFEEGMGVAFQVGDINEMAKVPAGFPTCSGNYDVTAPKIPSVATTCNASVTSDAS